MPLWLLSSCANSDVLRATEQLQGLTSARALYAYKRLQRKRRRDGHSTSSPGAPSVGPCATSFYAHPELPDHQADASGYTPGMKQTPRCCPCVKSSGNPLDVCPCIRTPSHTHTVAAHAQASGNRKLRGEQWETGCTWITQWVFLLGLCFARCLLFCEPNTSHLPAERVQGRTTKCETLGSAQHPFTGASAVQSTWRSTCDGCGACWHFAPWRCSLGSSLRP